MNDDIYPEDFSIDITPIVEQWPDERWEVAIERARREFQGIVTDEDAFTEAVADQLKRMVFLDSCRELEEQGYIKCAGVDENGELLWEATPKGLELKDRGTNES